MPSVLIRTLLIYASLEISMKLMGKRQIGEFQLSELVTTLLISELASLPITDPDIPILYVLLPLATIISFEVAASYLSLKFGAVRRLLSGKPSVLIRRGTLSQKELSRLRISCSELLAQLREAGIADINDVDYAMIEDDGTLSVFPKKDKRPPTTEETNNRKTPDAGIAHALIIDGEIIYDNLAVSGRSHDFLINELSRRNLQKRDVFLFTCDDAGSINIIKKERT